MRWNPNHGVRNASARRDHVYLAHWNVGVRYFLTIKEIISLSYVLIVYGLEGFALRLSSNPKADNRPHHRRGLQGDVQYWLGRTCLRRSVGLIRHRSVVSINEFIRPEGCSNADLSVVLARALDADIAMPVAILDEVP
jgi:hypothetical protein